MAGSVQDASLPDGLVVRVDAKTAYVLGVIQTLSERLARGDLNVLFVAWDGPEGEGDRNHAMSYYNKPDRLVEMSELLQSQSRRMPQIASLWAGNAPVSNRSFAEN